MSSSGTKAGTEMPTLLVDGIVINKSSGCKWFDAATDWSVGYV